MRTALTKFDKAKVMSLVEEETLNDAILRKV